MEEDLDAGMEEDLDGDVGAGETDGPAEADADPAAATASGAAAVEGADRRAETAATDTNDLQFAANTMMGGESAATKPYLERLPPGYVIDLLVIEWLEFLVEEADVDDAAGAVEFYRRIQWLGDEAADDLREYLAGFGEVDDDAASTPSNLSIDHHVTSLRYVSRLTGSGVDPMVFDCWREGGGGRRGL
jgi:flagellar protein FlaE/flagellar protein FlaC